VQVLFVLDSVLIVESMCLGGILGLLSRTQYEVCDFFEKLARDTYIFE